MYVNLKRFKHKHWIFIHEHANHLKLLNHIVIVLKSLIMNRSSLLLVFFLLRLFYTAHAQFSTDQQAQIDSLNDLIKENTHDTTVAHAYLGLSEIMYVSNPDTLLFLGEKARSIAEKNLEKTALNTREKKAFQRIRAKAINNIGFLHQFRGDYSMALEHFLTSLEIYQEIEDKLGLAESYNNIGAMYNFLGNVDKALESYQIALDLGRELGDKQIMAYSLVNIGYINKKQGNLHLALEFYQESLKIGLEVGNKPNIANTYNNIGVLYRDLGQYPSAMEYYQNALNIQEEIGHKKGMASTLGNMGHIYNLQGNIPLSLEFYYSALKIREEIGAKGSIARSLGSIGSIHKDQGDIKLALECYQKSLEIQEEIGDKKAIAGSLSAIGSIYEINGDLDLALEYYQKSLQMNEDLKDNQGIANKLNNIGVVYMKQGKYSLGLEYFQRSLKIYEEIGEKIGVAGSLINLASIYKDKGDYTTATKFGNQGLNIGQELGAVATIKDASELLFNVYKKRGQDGNALRMHELFIEMRDSLMNEENTRAVIVQEMNYQHENEQQAERLALAEQKHLDELRQQKKNQRTYVVYGLIVILGLFGYLIMRNKQRKKELLRQRKHSEKLEHIDQLKDQFLANTSHELRTPLQGIIGLSESLHEREKESRKKQELAMITSSGKRLSSLVNSILDFSKLKTHELQLNLKNIDLKTIADIVIQICHPLIKGKPVKLINEIDLSIPYVHADEDRIYQVMHNLLGNAIKFTIKGDIRVSATEKADSVQVSISDTGIGIPKDKLEHVFKSFEQVDASITRAYGGTGLGLTITRQLIELQGGNIWIESEVDKGTRVYFTMPKSSSSERSVIKDKPVLSKVVQSTAKVSLQPPKTTEEGLATGKILFNILIVDDEPINQQVLYNHLSNDKFRILQAMNGQEALDWLEKEKLDLVLLDIMMPKMSGYEVCREIRKKFLPSELPVIMITAKDQVTDLVEGLASGANDYLSKPFSKDELLARIKTHLNLYQINSAYLRFIPKEFFKALGRDSIIDVELGDQIKGEMTVLFSDIRSFTSITEKMTATESFNFLNEYLRWIIPAITSNRGFIDKYIGDAVMALFPFEADDALKAAIEAQRKLQEYNLVRKNKGLNPVQIGIGIHTGPLMLGTIGIPSRMEGTVISDSVNLSSRLEGLTKFYGNSLILSEASVAKLKKIDAYHYRFLSKVKVKGKNEITPVYEFYDGDVKYLKEMKIRTQQYFELGIKFYFERNFTSASVQFQRVLDQFPEDMASKIYLEHSARYMVEGVPETWDGVDVIDKIH